MYVVEVDFDSNVVFTDCGAVLEIETYVDEEETPCLAEESVAIYYVVGSNCIEKHYLTEEQLDFIECRYA